MDPLVWVSGFKSLPLGVRFCLSGVWLGLRIWISVFGSPDLDLWAWVSGFGSQGLSVWVWVSEFKSLGLGFRISISGFGPKDLDP